MPPYIPDYADPAPPPAFPPPSGLALLTFEEREALVRQVDQLLRAAIPLAPIGKYTRVTAVATSVVNRNHTIEYVIHGACPVLFGVVWPTAGIATARPTVVDQWASLGLYNTTRPWCTVLEFGGPAPPPTPSN